MNDTKLLNVSEYQYYIHQEPLNSIYWSNADIYIFTQLFFHMINSIDTYRSQRKIHASSTQSLTPGVQKPVQEKTYSKKPINIKDRIKVWNLYWEAYTKVF